MRIDGAIGRVVLIGSVLATGSASAMQFDQVPVSPTEVILNGRGPIVKDDSMRLEQMLAAVPQGRQVLALALDSPGGSVAEGKLLAASIGTHKLTVVIPSNSKCVSACFLLLAASPRRLAGRDALVGVHSASQSGEETDAALAVTTRMARDAATLGIPPAVIGKMVQTAPGRVEWLTQADLISMNVSVFDSDVPVAVRQSSSVNRAAVTIPKTIANPEFTAGSEDRRAWDNWLEGLHGAFHDGAVIAQTQTGLSRPGPCHDPTGASQTELTLGCEAARQRLASVEARLLGNPNYAAGWNSLGEPFLADEPAEAEYQGAFFCGRQVARLMLKIFPRSDDPVRQAVFSFGPQATSPDVPHGAFIVEGSIGLDGGEVSFMPVRWVSQPAGFNWVGLRGTSEDGGKTFGGRIVDNSACTVFTLKRVDDLAAAK